MAWNAAQAIEAMQAMARHGVRSFEQPVAAGDFAGMGQLVSATRLGVMADESFSTRESLRGLVEAKACTAVNVRISKCGGLIAATNRARGRRSPRAPPCSSVARWASRRSDRRHNCDWPNRFNRSPTLRAASGVSCCARTRPRHHCN